MMREVVVHRLTHAGCATSFEIETLPATRQPLPVAQRQP
jgi:hypothetical protein